MRRVWLRDAPLQALRTAIGEGKVSYVSGENPGGATAAPRRRTWRWCLRTSGRRRTRT